MSPATPNQVGENGKNDPKYDWLLVTASPKSQPWITTRYGECEFLGLPIKTVTELKSRKFHTHPLRYQSTSYRLTDAPGGNRHHRKVLDNVYQQLNQSPSCHTYLHPAFEYAS